MTNTLTPGDRVKILGGSAPEWSGLTATVLVGGSDPQEFVQLDDGLDRPDGAHYSRTFFWPENDLEKIEGPEVQSLRSRIRDLETRTVALIKEKSDLENEHEDFKKNVVKIAMRYASENDWCSTVARALEEMGLETSRRVRIQVTGTAEIEVPWTTVSLESSIGDIEMSLDSDYDNMSFSLDYDDVYVEDIF